MRLDKVLSSIAREIRKIDALSYYIVRQEVKKDPMGAFGLFLEPTMVLLFFLAIRRFLLGSNSEIHGMSAQLYFGIGIVVFFTFVRIALFGTRRKIVTGKMNVLAIPGITKAQLFVALGYVYGRIGTTVLFMLVIVTIVLGQRIELRTAWESVPLLIIVILGASGAAMWIHRITSVARGASKPIRFMLRRVLFWSSGLFYSLSDLPGATRAVITTNPLVHTIELLRSSLAGGAYNSEDASLGYALVVSIVVFSTGVILVNNYPTNKIEIRNEV